MGELRMSTGQPIYHVHPLHEFHGNPLVEVLATMPSELRDKAILLRRKPCFNENERELDASSRMLCSARLKNFMLPMSQHVKIFSHVYANIVTGYIKRNPMTPEGQRFLHGMGEPSTVTFITGLSGMGKSALIRSIMGAIGPGVIRHSEYNGTPFPETQILYIMQNVPEKCTPKNLCQKLAYQVDMLLGKNLCIPSLSKNQTQADYVAALKKILRDFHVGVIVIDEFQNIKLGRGANTEELLAMITNFRDELGVPIIVVGTPAAERLLEGNSSVARRLCDGGFFELRPPSSAKDPEWYAFCDAIWKLQWVKNPVKFSEEINEVLYDKCQGITGILLTLFINAQLEAIDGNEKVDIDLLKLVYEKHMRPLHEAMSALRSKDPRRICQFDDLYFSTAENVRAIADCRFKELQPAAVQVPQALLPPAQKKIIDPTLKSLKNSTSADELLALVTSSDLVNPDTIENILKG
jgi:AAA domain